MDTRRFELEVRSPFRLDLTMWAPRRRPHNRFPSPESLARAEPSHLRSLGFSQAKARSLIMLARQVTSGALDPDDLPRLDGLAGTGHLEAADGGTPPESATRVPEDLDTDREEVA